MAMFTPSFSGLKGRALFSLLFAAPMIHATDSVTTKDGETITVTADANTATEATDGYQPLSTSGDINRYADAGYPAGGQYG